MNKFTRILFLGLAFSSALILAGLAQAPATPTPAPALSKLPDPTAIQNSILTWLGVGSAVVTALGTFAALVLTKIAETKERLNRMSERQNAQETRLATVALNVTPPVPPAPDPQPPQPAGMPQGVKTGLAMLAAVLALNFTGCAWVEAHKTQLKAAGTILASKAAEIAGQAILAMATSPQDASHKADILDTAAYGLRTAAPKALDAKLVVDLVKAFTPEKNHWTNLADQAAYAYDQAPGTPAQKAEAVAMGLNLAAAKGRTE